MLMQYGYRHDIKIHTPNIRYQELSHKSRATFFAITLRYEIIFWKIFKKRFVFSAKTINVFQNTFNLY